MNIEISKEFTFGIASDLHCSSKEGAEQTTYLYTSVLKNPKRKNPVEALKDIQASSVKEFDFLVCPGDLTDKIDLTGLNFGYSNLKDILTIFNGKKIFSSIGNHDIDSRSLLESEPEINFSVKNLNDYFPFEGDKSRYWTDHFEVNNFGKLHILNLNTTASHLKVKEDKELKTSLEMGTLERIEKELKTLDNDKFKIALLHHHPHLFSDYELKNYSDKDVLKGGDKFLELLEKHEFDLVIHGHKHVPMISIQKNLPILSCGSLSSLMNLIESNSKNTFHIVHLYSLRDSKNTDKLYPSDQPIL